jgi:tRNA nucleotidyltransferase (CCA-adding enzyme)
MRLTSEQINQLVTAIAPYITGEHAELRLYGSRASDNLKGGDIDLLLLLDKNELVSEINFEKHRILASIKQHIGDQKIDFFITAHDQIEQDVFLKMIFPTSVLIHRW